jgi:RNA polymerase sigma-70 factor, ECF subfamily
VSQPTDQIALQSPLKAVPSQPASPEHVQDAYRVEFDYVCRSLARLGIRASDIEDVAHEVFLVLWRKQEEYDASRQLRPYLFGIAFRVAAAQRRRYGREVRCEEIDIPDATRTAEQLIWSDQARAIVLKALEQVALARRAVFIMYELDEIPMATIAKTLGIPLFTAYSRLRKARKEFEHAVNIAQRRDTV